MKESESSFDDTIGSMSTDHFVAQGNDKGSVVHETSQNKENISKNDLSSLLDGNDEDFVGLEY